MEGLAKNPDVSDYRTKSRTGTGGTTRRNDFAETN